MGGRRLRVPAAARPARRRAGDARAHAGAVRPARGHARRGRASASCASCARSARRSTPRTPPGSTTAGEPELAAEVRRAAGDYARAERALRGARARPRRRRSAALERASSCGPPPPPTRCCRCSPPTPACGSSWPPATASHLRRFGDWRGGFWLPECAYAPGLERELADHGVRAFCVDQTPVDGLRPPAARSRPRPARWRCRSTGTTVAARLERRATAIPAHPTYRDYHGRTVHDLQPWSNAGGPYDHEAALALAREHARDFVARVRAARLRRAAGSLCCALDTELLGHWWYEGPAWLGAVLEEAEAQGSAGHRVARASSGSSRWRASWRRRPGGTARTSPPGTRRAVGRAGLRRARARSCARWPRWPATAAPHAALERAARELLALQSSDWAFMVTRDLAGGLPARAAAGSTRDALDAALGRSDRLRGRSGARPAQPRARPRPGPSDHPVTNARPDPVLGVPAADRGRPRAPRAQAGREPGGAGRRGSRARPRARGGPAGGGGGRRAHPPRARARAPARPGRVRHLDRAHERRHARRRRRGGRPLRLRRRPRPRLARRRRRATTSRSASARRSWSRSTPPSTAATRAGSTSTRSPTSTASSAGWPTAPSA